MSDSAEGAQSRSLIAYVAPFSIPNGGAAAKRVLGNARAILAAGFEVLVISAQQPDSRGLEYEFEPGITIASTGERDAEHLSSALKRIRYMGMGKKTIQCLTNRFAQPSAVVLYSGYSPYLLRLLPWCRRSRIPLIFDAVEWYTAKSTVGFLRSPYLWNIEWAMRFLIPRVDGIIAISSYLADYYRKRVSSVAQVPPTLDCGEVGARELCGVRSEIIKLAYCGSASNDKLDTVIAALIEMDPEGIRFSLDVAGPSPEGVRSLPSLRRHALLPANISLHGQVSHTESLALVRQADYQVFLRDRDRVSRAGFPTKFVESMAVGTPVITNLTSDLGLYLRHGETGLICREPDKESLKDVLNSAIELDRSSVDRMRRNCRSLAEQSFDYRVHQSTLRQLLVSLGVPDSMTAAGPVERQGEIV